MSASRREILVLVALLVGGCGNETNKPSRDKLPPSILVATPADGSDQSASFTVAGSASDDVGVTEVTVQVDDGPVVTATGTENWSCALEGVAQGERELTMIARDAAQNEATASITVTVDDTPPLLVITSPSEGAVISWADVSVSGTADDPAGVTSVTLTLDDGYQTSAIGTSHWSATLRGLSNGVKTATVTATDSLGNVATAEVTFTVDAY